MRQQRNADLSCTSLGAAQRVTGVSRLMRRKLIKKGDVLVGNMLPTDEQHAETEFDELWSTVGYAAVRTASG